MTISTAEQIEVIKFLIKNYPFYEAPMINTVLNASLERLTAAINDVPTALRSLSDDELAVISLLGKAWNAFLDLPEEHQNDNMEFCQAIHHAQEKILCRPARREMNRG